MSVILVTGAPALEGALVAMEHGAFRYLQKPIDPSRFLADVQKAVARSREARVARRAGCGGDCVTCRPDTQCARLNRALERLRPVFQPIVSWRERRAYGYEGLIRCDEPNLQNPERLFDLAERFGRLPQLGRAIRDRMAGEAISAMPADAVLFVNVHPADVLDERLFDSASPLATIASRVVLEITERSTLASVVDVAGRLRALRDMGFRIAIDDLGAGYAGLSSFSLLEPDIAKLDMSLIRGIDGAERKRRVVRSLIHLCQEELGVAVVCEDRDRGRARRARGPRGRSPSGLPLRAARHRVPDPHARELAAGGGDRSVPVKFAGNLRPPRSCRSREGACVGKVSSSA
ncbi:MAG: EAL domain-containing response regulator [Polyangiaceae bacterium]